jgi:hypothetical protein
MQKEISWGNFQVRLLYWYLVTRMLNFNTLLILLAIDKISERRKIAHDGTIFFKRRVNNQNIMQSNTSYTYRHLVSLLNGY